MSGEANAKQRPSEGGEQTPGRAEAAAGSPSAGMRMAWFVALWLAGVGSLALIGGAIKLLLKV